MNRFIFLLTICALTVLSAESIYAADEIIAPNGDISASNAVLVLPEAPNFRIEGSGVLTIYEKVEPLSLPAVRTSEATSYVVPFGTFSLETTFIPPEASVYAYAQNLEATGERVRSHEESTIVFPNFVDITARPSFEVAEKPMVLTETWKTSGVTTLFLQYVDFTYKTESETLQIKGRTSDSEQLEPLQLEANQERRAAILEGNFTWSMEAPMEAYTNVDRLESEEVTLIGTGLQSQTLSSVVLTDFSMNGDRIAFVIQDPETPFNYWPLLALLLIPFLFIPTPRRVRNAYQKEKYGYVSRFGPWYGGRSVDIAAMVASAKIQQHAQLGRAYLQALPEARKPGPETVLRLETEAFLREGKRDLAIDHAVALLQRNIEADRPLGFHEIVEDIRIQRVLRGLKH